MSTNQTKNLKLHSWAPLDRFTREEFNDNWAGIDAAWGELDGRILAGDEALSAETAARKTADTALQKNIDAEAATRKTNDDALQTKINAKADASALTTETNTRASADTALGNRATSLETRATALEKRATTLETGRALIAIGAYTGNGRTDETNSQEVTVGFKPKAVFVRPKDEYMPDGVRRMTFATQAKSAIYFGHDLLTLTDTGFIAWNSKNGCQLNAGTMEYYYIALG